MTTEQKGSSTGDTSVLEPGAGSATSRAHQTSPAKIVGGLVGMAAVIWALFNLFLAFGLYPEVFLDSKIIIGIVALVAGVGGAGVFFWFLNMFVEGLPQRASLAAMPYAYVLPGLFFIGLMLIYPTLQTINYSFANSDSDAYVGLANYREIFTDGDFQSALFNNLLWLLVVPAFVVAFGVIIAVLADRLGPQAEKVAKSFIFLPMAISFVGASAIWSLIYAFDDAGANQTGLLNAIWTSIGGDPQTWLQISEFRLNSFLLMVILIWLQVGFAMILLSSAIKGVPDETIEAARIDGATEWQIFWRVVVPQIKGTMITVYITVTILVLKIFDIIFVTTNGRFESNVIANLFFNELFARREAGTASAIVVVLLISVLPILVYQVRHFRREELAR
ncbi:carbohydrate ABC transporter permease [Nocardioides sp. GCM10027113]|uniref:carbohydrate ABC transporter permease n=1 Tax=unclassified Nocardioides TaxID=2615069 RepID=UPI00361D7422